MPKLSFDGLFPAHDVHYFYSLLRRLRHSFDIRFIINVSNPLYAATISSFNPTGDAERPLTLFSKEGYRLLRLTTYHLPRVFDAFATTNEMTAGPLINGSEASVAATDSFLQSLELEHHINYCARLRDIVFGIFVKNPL